MAIYEDLEIEQGSSFRYNYTILTSAGAAYNLAGHSLAAIMKKTYNSSTTTATFLTQTTGDSGEIQMSLTDEQTATIKAGRYVFDVLMETPSSDKYRVVEGQITVSPGVTTIA
jgi:hypothetical protein